MTEPICELGFPYEQVHEILGERAVEFEDWITGQTLALCTGERYDHSTGDYSPSCGGVSHGAVVYKWDLERFLAGGEVID